MLMAYQQAAAKMMLSDPTCRLRWQVLAGIGRVESNHGRDGSTGITPDGTIVPPILGPVLNGGPGIAAIADTDGGVLDGDRTWDWAVGPMQFLPSTWRAVMGSRNPNNMFDAAEGAARYLCGLGRGDLSQPAPLAAAIFGYNPSDAYVATVLAWIAAYDRAGPTGVAAPPLPLLPQSAAMMAPAPPPPGPAPPAAKPTQGGASQAGTPTAAAAPAPARSSSPAPSSGSSAAAAPVATSSTAASCPAPTSTATGPVPPPAPLTVGTVPMPSPSSPPPGSC